jgi:heat-inducible transcriptional repressor
MELTGRKLMILSSLIKLFIDSGEPVGSESVKSLIGVPISSATIRGEMSELTSMGYLEQPHTSAGRVPTARAYRLYIDRLMRKHALSEADRRRIEAMLPRTGEAPDQAIQSAAESLAEFTSLAAVTTSEPDETARVKRLDVIPMGGHTALLVLLSTDGGVKSRVCRSAEPLTAELLEAFEGFVTQHICGLTLSAIQPALIQTLVAQMGTRALPLTPLVIALAELAREFQDSGLRIAGESNLFRHFAVSHGGAELFRFLSNTGALMPSVGKQSDKLKVLIGDENNPQPLHLVSLILSKYGHGGTIGVIGPLRMDYESLIPAVEYFAMRLGQFLAGYLDDEEET